MSVDSILTDIITSLEQTTKGVDSASQTFVADAEMLLPVLVKNIMEKSSTSLEGMSLLSLKSSSLLSYLNNLVLVVLAHLERLETDEEVSKDAAVKGTIQQRVTLEKGIKPLEKKLSYQLDKMVRSFHRMEEEAAQMEQKLTEQAENGKAGSGSEAEDSNSDSDSEDEDALSYRPDAAALAKMAGNKGPRAGKEASEKYRPPKISAVAPASTFDDRAGPAKSNRKLQSMEEYLAETSDLPRAESSIGATIMGHGRGGVKTNRDKSKEAEIQRYEENNFTRLPSTATKKSFKQKMAERANTFAGEDWSIFNNKRNLREGTARKRKQGSAWDRAKRRRD